MSLASLQFALAGVGIAYFFSLLSAIVGLLAIVRIVSFLRRLRDERKRKS